MDEVSKLIMRAEQVNVGLAEGRDRDQIIGLNKQEYGTGDVLATPADFAQHFYRNPGGKSIVPVIRNNQGDVVGCIWLEPLRIRFNKKNYLGATGTNMVIKPEYRNTFAFTKLMRRFKQALEDENIPLHFSFVSEKKYRHLNRSKSKCISLIPLLAKPLNLRSLVETYFASRRQRFLVSLMGPALSPFLFRQHLFTSGTAIVVQPVDQFDERFDHFWSQVQDKYCIMVIRDQDFLSWRFSRISGRDYHTLTAWASGQMLGYVVLRCSTILGVKAGLIMDFLVDDNKLGQIAGSRLLAEAETYFRVQQMSMTAALMPSSAAEYRILRRDGYVRVPQSFSPRSFRFAFFVHDVSDKDLMSLSAQSWFITMGDRDSH